MKFLTLKNREKDINLNKYRIKWDSKSRSNFQFTVKQYLKNYWLTQMVFEEFPVAGTRMSLDIFNLNKRLAIEVDGAQHDEYNSFLHGGSQRKYAQQVGRDMFKEEWCELNNIKLIRIKPSDLPLNEDFFNNLGVTL